MNTVGRACSPDRGRMPLPQNGVSGWTLSRLGWHICPQTWQINAFFPNCESFVHDLLIVNRATVGWIRAWHVAVTRLHGGGTTLPWLIIAHSSTAEG
jgi:hypothetical protein